MADEQKRDPDDLGALWLKEGKRGVYMTGKINNIPVVVFRNTRKKEGSNQPDWTVLRAKARDEAGSFKPHAETIPGKVRPPVPMREPAREPGEDDPFA